MGKRYFISSDIHSFYDEWVLALEENGFDINNPEHVIVVVGDIFDRGTKPLEVYKFLKSLPRERRILIRGNHEILLQSLVKRGYYEKHDKYNGTLDTLYYLIGLPSEYEHTNNFYKEQITKNIGYGSPEYQSLRLKYENQAKKIWDNETIREIIEWIDSDEWVNYWETPNHIFVHSWIPTNQEHEELYGHIYQKGPETYREDWRNATKTEWEDAMWGCPWKKAKEGLNQTNKTIVCGHWHTSDFFNNLTNLTRKNKKDVYDCPIFMSEKYKLIGLDACTAGSKRVNCLVLNEEEL